MSRLVATLLLLVQTGLGQEPGLPVRRVVLYKNGVGYFEHLGQVRDSQEVTLSFTSGQLNDVLKSLTVLDLGGGRITGVSYGSAAPIDRQLGDLRLAAGAKPTLTEFLGALRGARIEVRNGANVVTGRLLSVERKTRMGSGATLEVDYLSLVGDAGDVRTTEVSPAFAFRLLDPGLAGKVQRFLDLISATREADVRRMAISTAGSGERPLFVSYVSEVPVWKTTYRIVLSSKSGRSPLLQGWAIVDNTVGQDWENVELSLVAGAPQSFIQQLSQPYYSRRPSIPLPSGFVSHPQTHEATLIPGSGRLSGTVTDPAGLTVAGAKVRLFDPSGAAVAETITNSMGNYEISQAPPGPLRLEIETQGFKKAVVESIFAAGSARQDVQIQVGTVAEAITITAKPAELNSSAAEFRRLRRQMTPPPVSIPKAADVSTARSRAEVIAIAKQLGDLYEYKIKERITIRKNQSALAPIVQAAVEAEKVSIWSNQDGSAPPQRALWLTNSSGLTLDGGSFTVLEEETYAGEGLFDPIHPGEKRLVSYAVDLALAASSRRVREQQRVTRVRISHGTMTHESAVVETTSYTFRNEDTSGRTVIVEHPVRPGYRLRGAIQPVETSAGWMRFRLAVPSGETATLAVEETQPAVSTFTLTDTDDDKIALFLREKSIDGAIEQALRGITAQRAVVEDIEQQKEERETAIDKIFGDQERVRENLKALKGSAGERALVERYARQLDDQESRLAALRREIAQLDEKRQAAQSVLNRMVDELVMDVKL